MLEAVAQYFSLERPVHGARGTASEAFLFSGVLAGTIGRWVVGVLDGGETSVKGLVVGMIAAIVLYPALYSGGLKESRRQFVKWCVAFQNGYFWPALLDQIGSAVQVPH